MRASIVFQEFERSDPARPARADPSATRDLFIAFHPADRAWVEGLLPFLEAYHVTFSSELDIGVGESRVQEISRGIEAARHLLLVISPESMADPWTAQEEHAALARALDVGRSRPVLPVILHPAPTPALREDIAACRLSAADPRIDHRWSYQKELQRLLRAILGPEAALKPEIPLPPPPESTPLDGLWDKLVKLYATLTQDANKRARLEITGWKAGRLAQPDALDALEAGIAANLYLTRFGDRQNRAAPILEDLKALARALRGVRGYVETLEELERLLRPVEPEKVAGQGLPGGAPPLLRDPTPCLSQCHAQPPPTTASHRGQPRTQVHSRCR